MDKRYTLEYRQGDYDDWELIDRTYTKEEAICIFENHNWRHRGMWRILEEHTIG